MAMGEPIRDAWQVNLPTGPEPYHLEDAIKVKAGKTKHGRQRLGGATPDIRCAEGTSSRASTLASSSTAAAIRQPSRPHDQHSTSTNKRPSMLPSGLLRQAVLGVAR